MSQADTALISFQLKADFTFTSSRKLILIVLNVPNVVAIYAICYYNLKDIFAQVDEM